MKLVPAESLTVSDNRIRKAFPTDKQHELEVSIASKGLLHALVAQHDVGLNLVLVAGERRLRAMMALHSVGQSFDYNGERVPLGMVPVVMMADLSKEDIREAELEENVVRVDLSWQEKAKATAELYKLRVANTPPGETFTMGDMAEEITGERKSPTYHVKEQIILDYWLTDQEVAAASTPKEAIKVIKRKATAELTAALAEHYNTQDDKTCVLHVDAAKACESTPAETYDCIITDPPYGVGADQFGSQSDLGHDYVDTIVAWDAIMSWFPNEAYRICKAEAHLYLFHDFGAFNTLFAVFSRAGWNVWPRPLIWSKGGGMLPKPEHGPRYTYETILFANKGNKPVTGVHSDVIDVAKVSTVLLHAAQKPVDLYVNLLRRTCLPGDHILDPFCGSGTIFPAANILNLTAVGFEIDASHYNNSVSRLEEGK